MAVGDAQNFIFYRAGVGIDIECNHGGPYERARGAFALG
jgi:hypothetical protein